MLSSEVVEAVPPLQVHVDPQWRMGPIGPTTLWLCNACGVRYRQDRLLQEQEYRPAASPNFKHCEVVGAKSTTSLHSRRRPMQTRTGVGRVRRKSVGPTQGVFTRAHKPRDEVTGVQGPLGDCVLIGAPWGLVLAPTPLSSMMPEQEHRRSPPETVTMASDEPHPQLSGLGDAATSRSDAATMVAGGAGDEEEVGAEGPIGDFILIGTPWGLLLNPIPLSSIKLKEEVSAPPCPVNIPAGAANGEKQ